MSDITQNKLWQKFDLVKESYRGIAQRRIKSACTYGPPGVGKTFLARRLIPGIVSLRPRTESVIDTLYEHRNVPAALIEDADYFFNSEPLLNIAKIVLDSNEPRMVHDPRKEGHGTFRVHTPIVFGTNKDLHDPAQFSPKMRVHVEALVSRLTVMIGLSYDPIDCYEYAVWLATAGDGGTPLLKKHGLGLDASNEVLRFFAENVQTLDEISPRRLDMIAELRRKFPDTWKALSLERCVARRTMPAVTPHVITRPARAASAPAPPQEALEADPLYACGCAASSAAIRERIRSRVAANNSQRQPEPPTNQTRPRDAVKAEADAWLICSFAPVAKRIIADHGRSPTKIARELNEQCFDTPSGQGQWWPGSVHYCLARLRDLGVSLEE